MFQNYENALLSEFILRKDELAEPVETVYFGGGTPSLLSCESINRIISKLKKTLKNKWQVSEITIEVNPENINESIALKWKKSGITRVSMGVQSFSDLELKNIGRRHNTEDIYSSYNILRSYFKNISLDIICGLPYQTDESWRHSVKELIALNPEHISAYILETDCDSALSRLIDSGKIRLSGENETNSRFLFLCDELSENGYERYEISNFAKSGFRSRHNSNYWKGIQYLGLGPSAASYDGLITRRVNSSSLNDYLIHDGNVDHESEILSNEQLKIEYLLTRLRTCEGINLKEYRTKFSEEELDLLVRKSSPFISEGMLYKDELSLKLTRKGSLISDFILSALV